MPAKDIRVTNKSSTLIVIYNRRYARIYATGFFDLAFEDVPFSPEGRDFYTFHKSYER